MIGLKCLLVFLKVGIVYCLVNPIQETLSHQLRGSVDKSSSFDENFSRSRDIFTKYTNEYSSNLFNINLTKYRHLKDLNTDTENLSESSQNGSVRTATGGLINNILILFSILAFLGNALFMVNVFWMSR